MFFRYIDDLRLYMHHISSGWEWGMKGWQFNNDESDEKSNIQRTKVEFGLSLAISIKPNKYKLFYGIGVFDLTL